MAQPSVSVVVATHDRAPLLSRLVRALEQQDGIADFELVIVDDASTDDTWETVQRLAAASSVSVRPVRLPVNAGPAAARNVGWREASAPLVAFTDDDCVPQPKWLAALVEALRDVDLAQGRTEPNPEQASNVGPFSRTLEVRAEDGYYQTCNIAYRCALLEDLRGFDERFRHPAGEDTDLAWRARERGATTRFVDEALVYHDVRPSSFVVHLRDTWRWEGCVLTLREHPDLRSLIWRRVFFRRTHPPALLGLLGLLIAAVPGSRFRRVLALSFLIPYARFRTTQWPLRGTRRERVAALPLAFVADVTESCVMVLASVRYRTLVL